MSEGYEFDFIQVGTGEKNGDAIAARYGQPGAYKILVYDGGTKASGEKLVEHIKGVYQSDHVDDVVNSHPDADHASGLTVVLDELNVGAVHMHRPWVHSATILDYFHDGRITDASLKARLQDKMAAAYELEQIAISKKIPVIEPYQGQKIGGFVVMSPSKDWYLHNLVPEFTKSPQQKAEAAATAGLLSDVMKVIAEAKDSALQWMDDHWNFETLAEGSETSAENESSVVLYGHFADRGLLLTGDAGNRALLEVAKFAEASGMSLPTLLKFIQMPHHGSRHNVSPSVLNRILGGPLPAGTPASRTAFVSCSPWCTTHPRRVVTNAFLRRGFKTHRHAPQNTWIRHHFNMADRPNTTPLVAIPWHPQVEI